MKMISKYISYAEATTSQTATRKGINNTPSPIQLVNMQIVGEQIFDVVREHFDVPIKVSSFYRCLALNTIVKGALHSQHKTGQAIDMQGTGTLTNKKIFEFIKNNLKFDQLIWEFGNKDEPAWVHASYVGEKENRNQIIYVK